MEFSLERAEGQNLKGADGDSKSFCFFFSDSRKICYNANNDETMK